MLYGWASNVGMGTAIWLMARLCRTTLRHPLLLVTGGGFWNLGVLLGICGILMGDSTGYQWLEFPSYAAWALFVGYSLIASWAVLMFRFRRGDAIYITQWYLLGCVSLVPVDVSGRANHAFHCPGARRVCRRRSIGGMQTISFSFGSDRSPSAPPIT